MYLNVRGLVVRATEYKERDLLLTLLTSEQGRITVKVRNVRRRNSPLAVACQLLALSEFTLFEYKDYYVVNDAHVVELFSGLRQDVKKLALATYISQVASLISQEDIPSPELLPLVLNCLFGLSSLDINCEKIKTVFELRCACLAGFAPDLYGCHACSCESPDYFDVSSGQLECFSCRASSDRGIRMPISPGVLNAMRYICFCDHKKIFSFCLGEEGICQLSQISETFLSTQLERGFSALDIYKSLCMDVT
jgi:DNA repair protein RecO (recombination protein O)